MSTWCCATFQQTLTNWHTSFDNKSSFWDECKTTTLVFLFQILIYSLNFNTPNKVYSIAYTWHNADQKAQND